MANWRRHRVLAAVVGGLLIASAARSRAQVAPRYEVDPSWPQPLPTPWVLGSLGGVCVDARDHVLILNRQEVLDVDLDAGQKAPAIIEFDTAGKVVHSWGGDIDPVLVGSFHSCHFDPDNNVWILSTDSGVAQKYARDGSRLLLQIGKSGVVDSSDGTLKGQPLNSDAAQFFAPAELNVDRSNGDVYVDDGDGGGNRRIAVMDARGVFLRQWQPQGMRSMHCMALAHDGQLYLCNRPENRLEVFDRMGNFKKRIDIPWKARTPVAPGETKRRSGSAGSAVSISLSRDARQRFIYVVNQNSSQIDVVERDSGTVLTSVGRSGHFAGQFDQPLNVAADSQGNLYVTENRGKRIQKFRVVGQ